MATHSSSSSSSSTRKRSYVRGIPKICECKSPIVKRVSRTEKNPYRRYYSCVAASQLNPEENHCFKWVDEAFEDEFMDLKDWSSKFQSDMMLLGSDIIEMQKKMERDVSEAIADVKLQKQRMTIVFAVCVVVFVVLIGVNLL